MKIPRIVCVLLDGLHDLVVAVSLELRHELFRAVRPSNAQLPRVVRSEAEVLSFRM